MIKKLKATAKLYLLVFVQSAFTIALGWYGMRQMNALKQNTRTLYNDRVFPMEQLGDVRFFYESILFTTQQIKNHQMTFSKALDKVQQSQDSINVNWNAYKRTYLTPYERQIAGQEYALMKQADPLIGQLKLALKNKDDRALNQLINQGFYNRIYPAISKITELINIQVTVSRSIYQNSLNNYAASLKRFFLLILLSLIFVVPFSYFLVRNVKGLINDLYNSSRKIREAEEKYRSFIKYAGDAIFLLDENLQITEVNDSGCNLLGYSKEELLTFRISDLVFSEEGSTFSIQLGVINEVGGSLHERVFVRKDGQLVVTEVNVRVLEGFGYISIVRDVTEQKEAALVLIESEAKYRHLFENNPACIIIWDLETLQVLEVNNGVAAKYGYSKEEFKQLTVLDYRRADDHEKIIGFARAMMSNDVPFVTGQWTHLKRNGEEMLMDITSHKINYNNRKAILSLALDVTEQAKAQAAFAKSEENFHSLVDYAADAIFMVNDAGIIFDVNRSASEMLGFSKEELIGMPVLNLHLPETRPEVPKTWDELRKNKHFTDERKLLRKDGTFVDVQISRSMLPDGSGSIAVVHDITERKKAQDLLKLQNEKLLEIAFLQSHIVRRPTANILGLINLINDRDRDDPLDFELIDKLGSAANELDGAISMIVKNVDEIKN